MFSNRKIYWQETARRGCGNVLLGNVGDEDEAQKSSPIHEAEKGTVLMNFRQLLIVERWGGWGVCLRSENVG